MYDWNHDGKIDAMDYAIYEEFIEDHDNEKRDNDISVGGSYNRSYNRGSNHSTSNASRNNISRNNFPSKNTSTGVPVFGRFLIMAVIAMLVGMFSELLGFVIVVIWVYIELIG